MQDGEDIKCCLLNPNSSDSWFKWISLAARFSCNIRFSPLFTDLCPRPFIKSDWGLKAYLLLCFTLKITLQLKFLLCYYSTCISLNHICCAPKCEQHCPDKVHSLKLCKTDQPLQDVSVQVSKSQFWNRHKWNYYNCIIIQKIIYWFLTFCPSVMPFKGSQQVLAELIVNLFLENNTEYKTICIINCVSHI